MVTYIKNRYGDIITFIEWIVVDKDGIIQENNEYLYINNYYCCPKYRNKGINKFKKLSKQIIYYLEKHCIDCKYVYWKRDKYSGRGSIYSLERFKKKIEA